MKQDHRPCVVLSADDDEDAQILLQHAFSKAHVHVLLKTAYDGSEVIRYLSGEGPFSDRASFPLPDLLLLDWKMPKASGLEVLEYIRQRPALQIFPAIVFSTSQNGKDIRQALALGCHSYVAKPADFPRLMEFVRTLEAEFLKPSLKPAYGSASLIPFSRFAISTPPV